MESLSTYLMHSILKEQILKIINRYLQGDETLKEETYYNESDNLVAVDILLPQGFKALNWKKNTAVEISVKLYPGTYNRLCEIKKIFPELGKLVVICLQSYTEKSKDTDDVWIITKQEFEKKLKDSNSTKQKFDKKKITKAGLEIIELARSDYKNNYVSFFLGAGVSMSAQLPSWDNLLKGLLKDGSTKKYEHINQENIQAIFKACGNSSIIAGRYIFDGYADMKTFSERMREVLYEKYHRGESPLVSAIADAVKKQNVSQVITYNYDDIIENELNDPSKYFSVYGKNVRISGMKKPIYHVHGMIPQNGIIDSLPILSEKDYHDLYKNTHNWANVVQLNALQSTTCFFIGFSMTDPNQRRLLEYSRSDEGLSTVDKEQKPHYVFLSEPTLEGEASKRANKEHKHEMEKMMNEFGLNVIWTKSFAEIPILLWYIIGAIDEKRKDDELKKIK